MSPHEQLNPSQKSILAWDGPLAAKAADAQAGVDPATPGGDFTAAAVQKMYNVSRPFSITFPIADLFGPLIDRLAGWTTGINGDPRDWSKPDDWHFGYLRGRLARYKETGLPYI